MPRTSAATGRRRMPATRPPMPRAPARAPASTSRRAQLELATLRSFRTIFGSARRHDVDMRRALGISGSQLWALSEIARGDGLRVSELSARMALHQTTASNLVNMLVAAGLVRRDRDGSDQRVVRLHVSAAGARLLRRAPGPHAGLLVDALRRVSASNLQRLQSLLQQVTALLQDVPAEVAGQTLMGE